jgi:hypothetical protein
MVKDLPSTFTPNTHPDLQELTGTVHETVAAFYLLPLFLEATLSASVTQPILSEH